MEIAIVGMGRMGANMTRRLLRGGHECVVFDVDRQAAEALVAEGARVAASLEALADRLTAPRTVWVMVPAGGPTMAVIDGLAAHLAPGDLIVDGGNGHFKDDVQRASELQHRGIGYADVGVSGGVHGLGRGYCLMVGSSKEAFERLVPVLKTLAPGPGGLPRTPGRSGPPSHAEQGYLHCGPAGAGHFVKMVHNAIEYGLMQAYAEGFELMRSAGDPQRPPSQRYALDVADVAELWRRGSVIGSWLLDLSAGALREDPSLDAWSGYVEDSGEGRWAVHTAVEYAVPAEVLSASLYTRFRSRRQHGYAERLLSAMRHGFGRHEESGGAPGGDVEVDPPGGRPPRDRY